MYGKQDEGSDEWRWMNGVGDSGGEDVQAWTV